MPGLIDTHWHLWNTLYRSLAGADPSGGYFALNLRLGPVFEPIDTFRGARLALADALSSGVTTVHDWSHNIRGPEYADANLRAHEEVGLRARFSYGAPQGLPGGQTIDLADLERVDREWFRSGRAELVHLASPAGRPGSPSPTCTGRSSRRPATSGSRSATTCIRTASSRRSTRSTRLPARACSARRRS